MAGNRGKLSRERIVKRAIALADKGGIEALSMRRLASALNVEAMSLYHHVANKDAILDEMVEFLFSEMETPAPGQPWRVQMERRAHSMRKIMLRHAWAVHVLETRRNPGIANLTHHDAVIGCLRTAGFSVELAAHAYALMNSFIYGFVMQELTLPFDTYEDVKDMADQILASLPSEQFPHFAELTREHVLKPGYAYSKEFDFGLGLLLDGLARHLESEVAH